MFYLVIERESLLLTQLQTYRLYDVSYGRGRENQDILFSLLRMCDWWCCEVIFLCALLLSLTLREIQNFNNSKAHRTTSGQIIMCLGRENIHHSLKVQVRETRKVRPEEREKQRSSASPVRSLDVWVWCISLSCVRLLNSNGNECSPIRTETEGRLCEWNFSSFVSRYSFPFPYFSF